MRKNNLKNKFMHYLGAEIWIEYKACLYSFCIMVFYCIFLLCQGIFQAGILRMLEMVVAAYFMGYLQVYVLKNFDESDRFGRHEILGTLLCTSLYTLISYILNWFERSPSVTGLFFLFMLFSYGCIFVVNKMRRVCDTENLNRMLTEFKRGEQNGKCS